ncbi:hypothetical protein B1813_17650 [Saccharomonospora piscinae]|uniref:DUF2332 domain-containing protein n=1 Tax=Saccharomonospora piscinae TaxID=687388 RepID=A0A1V8ZZ96_SACPI|nr:DUF2332 domain-containing protein [Saccharomonospora piscinae]OQO90255.1 hypothetical protein B1813_17650 [Saccharomonospora piscinae]TLW89669.1 DUF2332 domain-containing protein [Saccharomonospora piscinae]
MASSLDTARERLRRFAEHEAADASPLYSHLAAEAATDDEVAGLLTAASGDDADPALLLAAAHRLVQAEPIHPLSRYYPSLGGLDGPDSQTWPLFRDFVLERADRVRELVSTRATRTDEVRRAAVLYPAVAGVAKRARGPVGLLEVGCGAGLLLGMDTFSYRYQRDGGEQLVAGPAKAVVGLHCSLAVADGAVFPALPKKLAVKARVGLDRHPVDAADEDELAWLEACVWADQPDRIRLLRTAAGAQRRWQPELFAGDAVGDLATAAGRVPDELPLVVFTDGVLGSLPAERREDFVAALGEIAAHRPLSWVAVEYSGDSGDSGLAAWLNLVAPDAAAPAAATGQAVLGVVAFEDGRARGELLASAEPQGQRMTWLAGSAG